MVLIREDPALDPDIIRALPPPEGDRSFLVRLRNRYVAARDAQVTVALYIGTPPVLVDNCVVEDITWGWGASSDSGVLTTADAGGGRITLYDPSRRFDPANPANPVRIGNRIQLVVAGVPAFTGRVDDVTHDLINATLSVVDDVSALAAIQFVETSVPAESTSARVKRILDLAAWPAGSRDIGAGGVNLQAGTVAQDAWSELVDVTHNELGSLWMTPAGAVAWRSRADTWGYRDLLAGVGSFEGFQAGTLPPGWTAQGTTVWTGTSGNAVDGTSVLRVSGDGVTTNPAAYSDLIPVIPGATYTITCWAARMGGALTARLYVDVPGVSSTIVLNWTTGTSAMAKLTGTWTCPADGSVTAIKLRWTIPALAAATDTWYFDAATMVGPGNPVAVFGCPPSDTALTGMATRADQSDLVNVLAAARRTGTQTIVTDTASLSAYGRHSHVQNDLELATDGDRDLWSAFYLVRQAQPFRSVGGFTARPGADAIAKCLGLPYGALVTIVDSGHGPDLITNVRWIGARWSIRPTAIELTAVLGQDQAVAPRARTSTIDLPAEWQAATPWGLQGNRAYLEPGLVLANIPAGAGPNQVVNGSFEDSSLNAWTLSAAGALQTSVADATAPDGARVLKITGNATAGTPSANPSAAMPVLAGYTYRVSGWMQRLVGTTNATIRLDARKGGTTVTNGAVTLVHATATWTYYEGLYTVPTDGSVDTLQVFLYPAGTPAVGADFRWDDVRVGLA